MKITTKDCKEFISKNAKLYNLPEDNWKRISKSNIDNGILRVFKHKDNHEIQILETYDAKLIFINKNEIRVSNDIEFNDDNLNLLPIKVQLFINTLRSLKGENPLFSHLFDKDLLELWNDNIEYRQESSNDSIFLHGSKYEDKSWQLLWDIDNSWNNDNIIKYIASYFSFAFSNDVENEDEAYILIQPKQYYDDGRIPMIFSYNNIPNPLLKDLYEIMESTIEFKPNNMKNNEDLLIQAMNKMKEIGIDFNSKLQLEQSNVNSQWIFDTLKSQSKKLKI